MSEERTTVWFAPAGSGEPIGKDALQRPLVANEDGVTTMEPLGFITGPIEFERSGATDETVTFTVRQHVTFDLGLPLYGPEEEA